MKITKTELEFDEIHKGKVTPIATGAHISFFKKFIGRVVHIILPEDQKAFWLLNENDLKVLIKEAEKIKFQEPYSRQRKESLIDSLNKISRHPSEFNLDDLINVVDILGKQKLNKKTEVLINKIKDSYSI